MVEAYYEIGNLYYSEEMITVAIDEVTGQILNRIMEGSTFVQVLRRMKSLKTNTVREGIWRRAAKLCKERGGGCLENEVPNGARRFKARIRSFFP